MNSIKDATTMYEQYPEDQTMLASEQTDFDYYDEINAQHWDDITRQEQLLECDE